MSGNYTQGYSKATTGTHASRTVQSDASFLIDRIKPTDKILDVGCGPGSITSGFGSLVPQGSVLGIDLSVDVLIAACDALPKDITNVAFQAADLLAGLPFPDDSFDVVFSSQLFPHLSSTAMKLTALVEMKRVLKPGGILATRDAAELHFYPRKYNLDRLWGENTRKAHNHGEEDAEDADVKGFPGGIMPALIRQAGFSASKISVGAGTTVHSGAETRRRYVDGNLGRLTQGDSFRESWVRAGISEAEIHETEHALRAWGADEDAWYVALQAEIVAEL
ncbi:methyltransferase [Plectosphaerella plurivora]|uniref:Methyltransferase n=1 Tax=Plectosphaerella plurivora TaxID=936078 RepID=A0A9P9A8C3_9PEZI|nr:methyltransferase [Plectosphaerella plurivora]